MYHVPHATMKSSLQRSPRSMRFVVISSVSIACISAFLMTVRYMLRYNDFDIRNGALFILIAIYCFMLGVILSGATGVITALLVRISKVSLSHRRWVFIRATVALMVIAVIAQGTWYDPQPGEESDALNRSIGRVIIPCILHFIAIVWHEYQINRAVQVDPATQDHVLPLEAT